MPIVDVNLFKIPTQLLPIQKLKENPLILLNPKHYQKLKLKLYSGPMTNVRIMMMASVALIAALEAASSLGHQTIRNIIGLQMLIADANKFKVPSQLLPIQMTK